MRYYAYVIIALFALKCVFTLPVDNKPTKSDSLPPNANPKVEQEIDNLGLEYGRYLQEVVMALEEDKDFSKKLENVSAEDIKSGKIAGELDFVHHNVRTKLDELKRIEMDRLRKLLKQQHELEQFGGSYSEDGRKWRTVQNKHDDRLAQLMSQYEHLDHNDPHKFSKDDLHKLIIKATSDLEELDKKRREEFKQYEMEKEYQYQQSLQNMSETEKAEVIKKHEEQVSKHKQHARLHSPGSKQQLEEVWQEQDHMPKEEFNPKVFFSLHDVNGDGYLDQGEVENFFYGEIKKLYDPNNPEDDPNEMNEEYHRMREQFYQKADTDRDGVISKKEFLDFTARTEFEKDEGWKGLDETPVYSQNDLREYEKHRQEALAHQYAYYVPEYHGMPPQHPQAFVPYPGAQPVQHGMPPHPNQPPPVGYQQQGAYGQQVGQPAYGQHPAAPMIPGQHPAVSQQGPGQYMAPNAYPAQHGAGFAQPQTIYHQPQQPNYQQPQINQVQPNQQVPQVNIQQGQHPAAQPYQQQPVHGSPVQPQANNNAFVQPPNTAYQQPPNNYQASGQNFQYNSQNAAFNSQNAPQAQASNNNNPGVQQHAGQPAVPAGNH